MVNLSPARDGMASPVALVVAAILIALPLGYAIPFDASLGRTSPLRGTFPLKYFPVGTQPLGRTITREHDTLAAPVRSATLESPIPWEQPLGTPPLGVAAPWWRRPLANSDAPALETCPGENEKCDYDWTNRVCAQLLDQEGKPLNWINDVTWMFW